MKKMKNKMVFALVLAILALVFGTTSVIALYSKAPNVDINNNNVVDWLDYYNVKNSYGSYDYHHRCDFNRDFTVNSFDSDLVLFVYFTQKTKPIQGINNDEEVTLPNGLILKNYNNKQILKWANYWSAISRHEYDMGTFPEGISGVDYYVCDNFANDFKNSYYSDYGEHTLFRTVIKNDWFGERAHAVTTKWIGGSPLNRSSWVYVTSNNHVYAYMVTLMDKYEEGFAYITINEEGYDYCQITWAAGEETGFYL